MIIPITVVKNDKAIYTGYEKVIDEFMKDETSNKLVGLFNKEEHKTTFFPDTLESIFNKFDIQFICGRIDSVSEDYTSVNIDICEHSPRGKLLKALYDLSKPSDTVIVITPVMTGVCVGENEGVCMYEIHRIFGFAIIYKNLHQLV